MEASRDLLRRSGRWVVIALALHSTGSTAAFPEACEGLPGTRQEIAASLRPDGNLELLALALSEGITADESVYQRLVHDIGAIRALAPARMG